MKEEYDNLFQSIKQDDIVLFSTSIQNNENLSFGRFPILSLCYLYNAKKIIKAYKSILKEVDEYKIIEEPFEIYTKFKSVAGRGIRLYINGDMVTYLEMLAILKKDKILKKEYSFCKKTEKQIKNLNSIYKINARKAEIDNDNFWVEKQTLSNYQVNFHKTTMLVSSVFISAICLIFLISSIITGFGVGNSPLYIYNQTQLLMALNSNKNYVLKNDIALTNINESLNFHGTLDGNGYTIYLQSILDESFINTNAGTIKNLNISYFDNKNNQDSQNEINKEISTSTSLFVGNNLGIIDNVIIKAPNLNLTYSNSSNDIFFNGFATTNSGNIKNCSIMLNAQVKSNESGEAFISGFVGKNLGIVEACTLNEGSNISTIDVDVSGIVNENSIGATTNNCKNYANILQLSKRENWSPNASGIALENYGTLKNCYNFGEITASSNNDSSYAEGAVFVGGICTRNYTEIDKCLNKGRITAFSKHIVVYAGGISAYSSPIIKDNILYFPIIKNCGVDAIIDITTEDENPTEDKFTLAVAGSISGFLSGYSNGSYLYGGRIENCYSLAKFENVNAENADKKFFFSSCVGATNISGLSIYLTASNNYCLLQEMVSSKIGAVIKNNRIAKYDDTIKDLILYYKEIFNIDIEEPYLDSIIGYESADRIMNQGVYWNE